LINIFFAPGTFGSTMEYMLRNFTKDFENVKGNIMLDGSMHSFKKEWHVASLDKTETYSEEIEISTVTYPWYGKSLDEIFNVWPGDLKKSKNVCIKVKDLEAAELNLLFFFYKIAKSILSDYFAADKHFARWNSNYTNHKDMQKWEKREWYSLFYIGLLNDWLNVEKPINQIGNFLLINNIDILNNLDIEFTKIVDHCGLTEDKSIEYFEFVTKWTKAQQYILEEFKLIDKVVLSTINGLDFDWSQDRLCFTSECIIQKRLRDNGYEIKCYNLNDFPTNSEQLYNLLEKQ